MSAEIKFERNSKVRINDGTKGIIMRNYVHAGYNPRTYYMIITSGQRVKWVESGEINKVVDENR